MRHLVSAAGLCLALVVPSGAQTWPFSTATVNYDRISATLGECRSNPGKTSCDFFHNAVDIQPTLNCGSTVYSAIAGTATFSEQTAGGFFVTLGPYEYMHLASHTMHEQWVPANYPIGLSSGTGVGAGGCHLHFAQAASATAYKTPLLTFAIQDIRNGSFDEIVLRQGVSTLTLTAGATISMGGSTAVDLLVRGNDSGNRLFGGVSTAAVNWAKTYALVDGKTFPRSFYYFDPDNNVPGEIGDVYSLTVPSSTFNPFVEWYWMGEHTLGQGTHQICLTGWDLDLTQPRLSQRTCVPFQVDLTGAEAMLRRTDGTPIPNGGATNETSVVVSATDTYGLQKFVLSGPTTATQTVSGTTADYTFTSLTPNSSPYTVSVHDVAGNVTSGEFLINTGTQGAGEIANARGITQGGIANSTNALSGKCTDNTGAGICSAALSGPSYSRMWSFDAASEAQIGLETSQTLSQGTFTLTCTNCAGSSSQRTVFYSTAAIPNFSMYGQTPQGATFNETQSVSLEEIGDIAATRLRVKVTCLPGGYCNAFDQQTQSQACAMMRLYSGDGQEGQGCYPSPGAALGSELLLMPQSTSFVIRNTSLTATDFSIIVEAAIYKFGNYDRVVSTALSVANGFTLSPGGAMSSSVSVQEVLPYFQATSGQNAIDTTVKTTTLQSWACGLAQSLAPKQLLWLVPNSCIEASGSDLVFLQKTTTTFIVQGSTGPPAIDSSSVRIYGWTGSSWAVSGISRQGAVVSTSSVIVATGAFSRSGLYAILFSVTDGSAPVTSWSIQGSSTGFAGITFVSTYSYLVLSSTDPVVNGFHSGLATTYYRIDGLPGDVFTAYSSSLSFLPGSHWVDYFSTDFAGNSESVKRATITVTAGSVTRLSGDLQVDGNLLVGFLGSGAKAEVVARAEYDYALMVSSVDGRAMLAVDNANFVSIGTAPASGRLTLAGVAGDSALALRSGNSTASVTGAQIAFGYDGTSDLRHSLYTQHGAANYNNKMVFKLWTPATGSSSTLGNLPVLSLEGSSKTASGALVHIMPACLGANELVVSNGAGLGLGNVLRWERWQPSAAEFKTGIERLGAKDDLAAWDDVMALQPARYRRKVTGPDGMFRADPTAPLERGYIFEEIPESIRAASGGISVDERLVNVEMALKAAIREMNALEERLGMLKAAKK